MTETYKIVFLDIDGVLIPIQKKGNPKFNSRNIDNLNELIKKTGAKIVITSDWRAKGIEYIKDTLFNMGVRGDIIDMTPKFTIEDENYGTIKIPRGLEIKEWINKFNTFNDDNLKVVTSYVILDDHEDMLIEQIDNYIKIDPLKGFDSKFLKNAVDILNNKNYII